MVPLLVYLSLCLANASQSLGGLAASAIALRPSDPPHPAAWPAEAVWSLRTSLRRLSATAATHNLSACISSHDSAVIKGTLRAAGRSRDASASLALLGAEPTLCRGQERRAEAACASALTHFDAAQRAHAGALLREWAAPLRGALLRLDASLASCPALSSSSSSSSSSAGALGALQRQTALAAQGLQALGGKASLGRALQAALHALRAAVKAMRYVLEAHHPLAQPQALALHALADALGRIQDLSVLAGGVADKSLRRALPGREGREARQGLGALSAAAERLAHASALALRAAWFLPPVAPFLSNASAPAPSPSLPPLTALLNSLSSLHVATLPLQPPSPPSLPPSPHPSATGGLPPASASGLQLQQRWRLSALPAALAHWWESGERTEGLPLGLHVVHIADGYVPGAVIIERLRSTAFCSPPTPACQPACSRNCSAWIPGGAAGGALAPRLWPVGGGAGGTGGAGAGGCSCHRALQRTVKVGVGALRLEREEVVGGAQFEQLWPLTQGQQLRKRRFLVPVEGGGWAHWQVDVVLSGPHAGTALVEVEVEAVAEAPDAVDEGLGGVKGGAEGVGVEAGAALQAPPPFPQWLQRYVASKVTVTLTSAMLAH